MLGETSKISASISRSIYTHLAIMTFISNNESVASQQEEESSNIERQTHLSVVNEKILLEWNHLSFIVPISRSRLWSRKSKNRTIDIVAPIPMNVIESSPVPLREQNDGYRILLDDISGKILPGELVAMMGASGAGKSTLLNILAGRFIGKGKLYGSITINGQSPSNSWRSIIGYVEQSDLMYPYLTVEETITTSAFLRLSDAKYTRKQKLERVEKVISVLGLSFVRKNRVGEEGPTRISGGERKRVSIAVELVADPKLLFLDEPTSGLDSFTAFYTIKLLRDYAKSTGKCILLTIHQPRYHILELFDRLFLLSQGKMVFQGEVHGKIQKAILVASYNSKLEAVKYFSALGFNVPANSNPSDFFLDVVTLDARNEYLHKNSQYRVKALQEAWKNIELAEISDFINPPSISATLSFFSTPEERCESSEISSRYIPYRLREGLSSFHDQEIVTLFFPPSRLYTMAAKIPEGSTLLEDRQRWGITLAQEFIVLFKRNMLDTFRNFTLLKIQAIQIMILTLLLGLVFLQLGHSQTDIQNRIGVLFFFVINITFTIISPILNIFPIEKKIISRERAAGSYRSISVFVAKSLSLLPILLIFNTIYACALYWLVGLKATAAAFFTFFLYIWILIILALSLGLAIGSFSKNLQMAQILGPTIIVTFVIFGGNFVNPSSIPGYLVWIFWISPIQYIYKALMQNEFYGSTFTCDVKTSGCITQGEQVIERYHLEYPSKWICFLIVLGMTICYLLIGLLGVKINTAPKRQKILADKISSIYN